MEILSTITGFVLDVVVGPPSPVPEATRVRVGEERRYRKELLRALDLESADEKLKKELLLCERRIAGYLSVYPELDKDKIE